MKINIDKAWEEIELEFDTKKIFHFFALANIMRYSIEKESIKNDIDEVEYSIMHKFLHKKSVDSDYEATMKSLINILIKLPNKYPTEKIIEKLSLKINVTDPDYFKIIENPKRSINRNYRIKLNSVSIFTYKPLTYLYTGKKYDDNTITFISDNRMELGNVYEVSFGYCKINNDTNVFCAISSNNITEKIRSDILLKYKISNPSKLFDLLKGETWPRSYTQIENREIISDIATYFANPIHKIEDYKKWKPFFDRPFVKSSPSNLSIYYLKMIIMFYGADGGKWLEQYELKKIMDSQNIPFVTNYDNNQKNFNWFKEENDKLYYDDYFHDIELFKRIFKKTEDNGIFLNEKNTEANVINMLKTNKSVILMGPAGHGKSFTIKKIAKFYKENGKTVKLLCPTWKSIEIYENEIKNSTIKGLINKEKFFEDVDLLIVDEMSLISEWKFIKNISIETRIIIAGDRNQLPPIGTKNKKYEWLIAAAENNIINLTNKKNWRIENAENKDIGKIQKYLISEEFNHKIKNEGVEYISSNKLIVEKLIELSKNDYIIITPKNGGLFGADFLNRLLKNKGDEYSIGDKVVFVKGNKTGKNYYNGLFGKIKDITSKRIIVSGDNGSEIELIKSTDPNNQLPISHAYAINAHKAQGSTIEKVIVLVNGKTNYDWLYTAYSRASVDAKIIFFKNDFELIKRKNFKEKLVI